MAVLQKIRQRSLLLILVIGFSLLAFIVQDLYRKGGLSQTSNDVGSINGKGISFEDFRIKVSKVEKAGKELPQLKQLIEFGIKRFQLLY